MNRSTGQSGRTRQETGRRGNVFPSAYTPRVERAEVGRSVIEARTVPHVETLSASAQPSGEGETTLFIEWETTQLRIPIRRRSD